MENQGKVYANFILKNEKGQTIGVSFNPFEVIENLSRRRVGQDTERTLTFEDTVSIWISDMKGERLIRMVKSIQIQHFIKNPGGDGHIRKPK